ncbi:MAG TPA: Calx-beta domain-containing protein [Pyrinomonadaceae bacterium]|nr:Calx-beta domain-containing protein [Pyrinomonadaceae bacterium]
MFKASFLRPRSRWLLFLLVVCFSATTAGPAAFFKQSSAVSLTTLQQELQRRFRKYEISQLDPAIVAQGVRQTGKVSIMTPSRTFELDLMQNDLRAPNYRAEEVTDGGFARGLPTMPIRTYKGTMSGEPRSEARFTIDEETIEGLIITPGEWYFVEEVRKYSAGARATDYLVYKASDVLPDASFACAVTLKEQLDLKLEQLPSVSPELVSPMRVIEMATEADFDYVNALGGSAAANNEILSIMNQVQGIYETQVGLTFSIVFQHTWDTSADPYSVTNDASGMLQEFRNYWNANFASTPRDTAYLWTGRTMSGAGIAYLEVICSAPSFSYGLSVRTSNGIFKVTIPAHEIGHNLSAEHSDGTAGCENTIMQGVSTSSTTFNFCQLSIDQITSYVNANSSCLALAGSGSQIQFSNTSYSSNEGTGVATLTVTRSGSTSSTATVEFTTTDGSAQQRSDYTTSAGTLSFGAGETSKVIEVLISDDLYVEGNETISVTLGNATGATLGSPGTATVTILNNDTSQPSTNPLDDAQFFVRQHYYDFLNRQADPGGLSYWSGQITGCGADQSCIRTRRVAVSNAFFYELEFQQTGAYVYRLYRAAYGNNQPFPNPDTTNVIEARKIPRYDVFVSDRARVVGGSSLPQAQSNLANAFVLRSEFLSIYPSGLSGPDFVDAILARIALDSGVNLSSQRSALISLFNQGGRGAVLYRLADDNVQTNPVNNRAFIDAEYNRTFVYTQYAGYLRRDADTGGLLFWLGQVNGFPVRDAGIQSTMVCAFITSAEYQQRFSPVVTRSNSECGQ